MKFQISNFKFQISNKGQSLAELIIVMAVAVVVVGALVFATIATTRNAQFAKNQAQATKLAQEGIEWVRIGRDRSPTTIITGFTINGGPVANWQDSKMWGPAAITGSCNPCYFRVSSYGNLNWIASQSNGELLPSPANPIFNRTILISDVVPTDVINFAIEKKVTAIVQWTDFAGSHESRLSTILRKI